MPSGKFRVGIAQVDSVLNDVEQNLRTAADQVREAKSHDVDLLIFPELALSGYSVEYRFHEVALRLDSPQIERLKELSRQVPIATGFVEETDEVQFFDSAIYLSRGKIRHLHRKVYLPTYGIFDEKRYFGSGRKMGAFKTRLARMAMLVCGDAWHLPLPYLAAQDGADVLLILAASCDEGLSASISCRKAWERMNQSYALTLSCFVVFANRVGTEGNLNFWGGSHIVLPDGNVLVQGRIKEPDLVIGDIDLSLLRKQRIVLPFRRDDSLEFVLDVGREICEAKTQRRHAVGSEPDEHQ